MTDYTEEQKNELEAIESIYPEELKVLKEAPNAEFEITLTSQEEEDYSGTETDPVSCVVKFTYTDTYPDEAPFIEITDSDNLEDDQITEVEKLLNSQAEENIGMVMVFTLVSAVQEELTCIVERRKKQKIEEQERKKKEEEELEMKKFEGTRVTIENFLAWKTKFDAAMAEVDKKKWQTDPFAKKLSGKEVFMKDSSMMDSDVQFLQEEGDQVEVDESLFQDMDDIDLDAETLEIED